MSNNRCTLASRKCLPCEGGVPQLTGDELTKYKTQLDAEAPGWQLNKSGQLEKTFRFGDYEKTLAFVNQIGAIAEEKGHHPDITFTYGVATVMIWTHAIKGLSENDFTLAAAIGEIPADN